MTYLNLNPDRLERLVYYGLSAERLQSFFEDCRSPLILAGEKAQSLPRNHKDAAKRISHFSAKAHAVFGKWLKTQTREGQDLPSDQIAPRFRAVEREGVEFSDEELLRLYRAGIDNLYDAAPQQPWLELMASPLEAFESGSTENQKLGIHDDESSSIFSADDLLSYFSWLMDTGSSTDIKSGPLRFLAELGTALKSGDSVFLERFGERSLAFHELANSTALKHPEMDPTSAPRGVIATAPQVAEYDSNEDYLQFDVIAVARRTSVTGPTFLDAEGFLINGVAVSLERISLRTILPTEGRLIIYPDQGLPMPNIGEYQAYRVVRNPSTPHSVKVRVAHAGAPMHAVVYVPLLSTDYRSVREWLTQSSTTLGVTDPMFVTSDNLCIKPKGDSLSRIRAPGFDWVLDCWDSLQGIELGGGTYVSGPIPRASKSYDCSPITVLAKKLLRELADSRVIGLTKKQISDVITAIGSVAQLKDSARVRQLSQRLEAISNSDQDYAELVSALMQSPAVKADIEQGIRAAALQSSEELTREKAALENLRSEKRSAERSLSKLKDESDAKIREVRAAIKRAFSTAKEKELETLGQLALFQGLIGATLQPPLVSAGSIEPMPLRAVTPSFVEPSDSRLSDVFRSAGVPESMCESLEEIIRAVSAVGLPVTVVGPGANVVAMKIGQALSRTPLMLLDVSVGAEAIHFAEHLCGKSEERGLILRNANLSDLSIYGPRLLDRLATRFFDVKLKSPYPPIVFGASSGPAYLPWPSEVTAIAALVDLTVNGKARTIALEKEPTPGISMLRRKCIARLTSMADADIPSPGARTLLASMCEPTTSTKDARGIDFQ